MEVKPPLPKVEEASKDDLAKLREMILKNKKRTYSTYLHN
jgi:hypothetical protein